MPFGSHVKLFEFAGIPMIGNKDTGDVIGLSEEGLELCQRLADGRIDIGKAIKVQPELLRHLEIGGFLVAPQQRTLEAAYLHVTQRCNLDCVGCYSDGPDRNCSTDLSLAELDVILGQLAAAGVRALNISGGEPFLRSDLPVIVQLASQIYGINEINVLTNGTVRDQRIIDGIAPFVTKVSVSFDGVSPSDMAYVRGEQRFDDLVSCVRQIQRASIPVVITATVHSKNLGLLGDYAKLADQLGAVMNYSLLTPPSHGAAELGSIAFSDDDLACAAAVLWELADKGVQSSIEEESIGAGLRCRETCGAGTRVISVGADGTVYPCHMMHDERFALGNLLNGSLNDMVVSDKARAVSPSADQLDGCKGCDALPFCAGGCRARAVACGNGISGRDAYCAMSKAYYREAGKRLKAALAERK